jgi:hypothetical protein
MAYSNGDTRRMELEIEPWASRGSSRTVTYNCGTDFTWTEPRPNVVRELEPGIMYVDIDRVTDAGWNAALPRLWAATGIIFDLRGYTRTMTATVEQRAMARADSLEARPGRSDAGTTGLVRALA